MSPKQCPDQQNGLVHLLVILVSPCRTMAWLQRKSSEKLKMKITNLNASGRNCIVCSRHNRFTNKGANLKRRFLTKHDSFTKTNLSSTEKQWSYNVICKIRRRLSACGYSLQVTLQEKYFCFSSKKRITKNLLWIRIHKVLFIKHG